MCKFWRDNVEDLASVSELQSANSAFLDIVSSVLEQKLHYVDFGHWVIKVNSAYVKSPIISVSLYCTISELVLLPFMFVAASCFCTFCHL